MKRSIQPTWKVFVFALSLFMSIGAQAQLTVDTAMPIDQMIQNLVGEGVQIQNIQVTAADGSYGYYYSNGTELGTNQGLLLTTGQVVSAIGPNNSSGLCLGAGCDIFDNNFPGSDLLDEAQDRNTFDACMIEFDIIPSGDSLRFSYSFASEEYLEWVGSPFNDVFGFFITGPGVGTDVNIALVPNTSNAVAINNVNNVQNPQYFQNNITPPGQGIQFDGFTVDLAAAVGNLTPCETYHLKLIIADGSDRIYNSAVFVNQIDSNPIVVLTATAGGLDYMIEDCNDGQVTFSREEIGANDQEVIFYLGGTATEGVDYTQLGNGVPGDPIIVTIPGGSQSVSIPIEAFADGVDEGNEYITIYLGNPLCTGTVLIDSTTFFIQDFLEVEVTANPQDICAGTCTTLNGVAATSGLATFEWSPLTTITDPNSLVTEACPLTTTTYTLTSTVSDCVSSDEVTINVSFIEVELTATEVNCEGGATGTITSNVIDAVAPFTYEWTGPDGFTSTDAHLTGVAAGTYCLTVTDAGGCQATACVDVIEVNELNISTVEFSNYTCHPISCFGAADGSINIELDGGVAPFTYEWAGPNGFSAASQDISGLEAGDYVITITDDAGCVLIATYTLTQPEPISIQVLGAIDLLCTGVETGEASVEATGGCAPFFYSWSHDPNLAAPVATNLGSGIYNVSVEDVNGCTSNGSVEITINDPIDPITVTVDDISVYPGGFNTSCPNASDAFVDITAVGGSLPYTFEWVLGNVVVSTDEDLLNVGCGEYTLTVTDGNGCEWVEEVIITCVPAIDIDFETDPNPCGDPEAGIGTITITNTTGGHGPIYTYDWVGPNGFIGTGTSLTGLNSGDYTVTVTDALGCLDDFTINVGTNDGFTVSSVVNDPICANVCAGSINLTVDPAGIYNYTWTGPNGSLPSTQDQNNLCGGTYSVIISDNGGCEETFTFDLVEPQPIVIDIVSVINPICFGQNNGSIDIVVSGGTGALSVSWAPVGFFPGSTSTELNNLLEGCYSVTVTDANGCTETETVCLDAPQVMDIFVEVTEFFGGFNISCQGADDGAISVTVSGGTPNCTLYPNCYLYDWSDCASVAPNPIDANNLTGLGGGSYCVNVTDANGCLATTTIDLLEPQEISAPAIVENVSCFGLDNGSIDPNLEGGSGTYVNYNWTGNLGSNSPNASSLTNLAPGDYTLNVFDTNGCQNTFQWTITEPELLEIQVIDITQLTCPNSNDSGFEVAATGGTLPYTFTITGPMGNLSGPVQTGLEAGLYTVTVTDANDCEASTQIVIDPLEDFFAEITANIVDPGQLFTLQCNGDTNGSLTVNITGGVTEYSIEWTDENDVVVGTEATINNLGAGTYCVIVTDANGCETDEVCYEITEPAEPLVVDFTLSLYPGDYNISCFSACDGSIDLTVSGGVAPYTFQWELGNGVLDSNEDQIDLCAGFYEVLVTDANGCAQLIQFTLNEPAPIVIQPTVTNVSCFDACDGSIEIEVLGDEAPFMINWTNPILPEGTSQTNLCSGTYEIEVTDNIGCIETASIEVTQPEVLQGVIDDSFDCNSGDYELCASFTGGTVPYSYAWSNGATTSCIDVITDGIVCVTVTDANGCALEVCFDAVVPEVLDFDLFVTSTTCGLNNGSIDLVINTGNSPYTFDWSGNGVDPDSEDQIDLGPGSYDVTVSDAQGCEVSATAVMPFEAAPEADITATNILCNGDYNGTLEVTFTNAAEPIDISWTFNGDEISTSASVSNLGGGSYTLTWTDDEGCTGSESVSISEPSSLSIDVLLSEYDNGFNVSVFNGNDGSIDIAVSGGTPQYTYDWSPNDSNDGNEDASNLAAGVYTFTVTDLNGCTADTVITLTQPTDLLLSTGLSPNGDGYNDAYVILGASGFPGNSFKVFNRWGNLVFEQDNYSNQWSGQSKNGGDLPDGTYYVIFVAGDREFNTYVDLRR